MQKKAKKTISRPWQNAFDRRYLSRGCLSPGNIGWPREQTQCSLREEIPLCFTPNGLLGSLSGPIFFDLKLLISEGYATYPEITLRAARYIVWVGRSDDSEPAR